MLQQPADANPPSRKDYAEIVEDLDAGVGRILDALEVRGLAQKTLVVFISDNGGEWLSRNAPFFHRKDTVWEGGIRVPAIFRWTSTLPAGRTLSQVGITMDFTATAVALAGGSTTDSRFDGIDLLPILRGTAPPSREDALLARGSCARSAAGGAERRLETHHRWLEATAVRRQPRSGRARRSRRRAPGSCADPQGNVRDVGEGRRRRSGEDTEDIKRSQTRMVMSDNSRKVPGIRWWPAAVIALAGACALGWVWLPEGADRQSRVMSTFPIAFATLLLLAIWLIFFSRLSRSRRRWAALFVVATVAAAAATLRIRGVTGDLVPILEWRWASREPPALKLEPLREGPAATGDAPAAAPASTAPAETTSPRVSAAPAVVDPPVSSPATGDYPQFLGAARNGSVAGVRLADDWTARPPRLVWRRPIGAGWSGFAVPRGLAITQEQRGTREMVVAYNLVDGTPRWSHGDEADYESTIAGDGPRATPTISRGRVFTLGSTGLLNCLDLETGKAIWRRDIGADNESPQPDFGRSQLATRRRRFDRRQRRRAVRSLPGCLSSRFRRARLAGRRRCRELQLAGPRDARRRAADRRAQSVERRRPRSRDGPRAVESSLAAHGADRRRAARRVRQSRPAVGGVRRGQSPPADLARRRRRQPDARLGEHAPQGEVHQPGPARRVRATDSTMACWCAWIRQPANGGGRAGDTATARRSSSATA